ncbi:hypothetical protein BCR32DRAFT_281480 [Anaeromyces robustus]|uniref:Uncharacterized protein n=1 Tax=Anaeromyces robustus TaxID=1754192 RepID=A0A1Y1X0N1_9FUNG|nr:hypothetical protein BCR32DRAFT_281480 [Anaeromyces robustus]|eukprot:ORX79371.1 hypothetical protein BCR32DRAFT_281480 [Anaeromyces robustus]
MNYLNFDKPFFKIFTDNISPKYINSEDMLIDVLIKYINDHKMTNILTSSNIIFDKSEN